MTTYLNTEITIQLEPMTCGVVGCGIAFAISETLYRKANADHGVWFYCPNGHHIHFSGRSTQDKLRDAEARSVALQDQLEASAREAEATRAALLRDRQRFANGVCPCCNRSFENVRRHMATKHPDYDSTKIEQPNAVRFACSCGRAFDSLHGLHIHQSRARTGTWYEPSASGWRAHLTKV